MKTRINPLLGNWNHKAHAGGCAEREGDEGGSRAKQGCFED